MGNEEIKLLTSDFLFPTSYLRTNHPRYSHLILYDYNRYAYISELRLWNFSKIIGIL
jgi:hypothetical protein